MTEENVLTGDDDDRNDCFNFQLEFIKKEYDHNHNIIDRIDNIAQGVKNWSIATWAGSITLALAKGPNSLQQYIILTSILPMIFWFLDAHWRHVQRTLIFRVMMISEFLNSSKLHESFQKKQLVDFKVIDPRALRVKHTMEYKQFASIRKTLLFRTVFPIYAGQIVISLILGTIFLV